MQIFISTKSVYAKYISLRSKAVSFSISDSPLQHRQPPHPTPRPQRSASPSFICPPSIQPLHSPTSSFTCSQIYFSLSLSPGQPTSLPPSSLSLGFSPCSVTVSSHSINQALRPGCSAARHRAVPVWSHQCQSVSLTLSVTLKRFRLPDIVCFLRPDPGQEMELSRDSA